mgnify:CR=1 FL=1
MSPSPATTAAIVDIGANVGDFAVAVAQRNPTLQVFAVEPIPKMARHIEDRAAGSELSNLVCIEAAVDELARKATFHVADHHDRGVSSLLEFDKDAIDRNEYWKQRADLHFTNDIVVQVDRMDRLLPWDHIDRISFLKIDAQGCDMRALRSFGDKIDRIDAGMVEVPGIVESRLYVEEVEDLPAAIYALRELGFAVHGIKPNDHAANEFNLYFHRHGLDWRAIERNLRLAGIPLYDGKHYWHLPSDRLQHFEAELEQGRQAQAELAEARRSQERDAMNSRTALLEAASEVLSARNESQEQEARVKQLQSEIQLLRNSQSELLARYEPLLEVSKAQSHEVELLRRDIEAMRSSRAWRMVQAFRSAMSRFR